MILLELEIQDYKQFAGKHLFRPSPEGVIGIIGHNGAGKTTLFEAIEWCLYQPREIGAEEVPPRGLPGKPRVKLTMQEPHTGVCYVVERSLSKSKTARAEIYRADAPETRIVEGSRQVSEYVARTLVGLGHRAFVSTFFTRQKELTFFGNLKETDRRREVGRLLGMETIREAQKLIAGERTEYAQQARVLAGQYQDESAGRDFTAELAAAGEAIEAAAARLASATAALTQAEAAHQAARLEVERISAIERQDAAIRHEIARIEGDIRASISSRDGALAELARMDQAAAERAELAQQAASLEAARALLQTHELERERHLAAQRLRAERDRANAMLRETAGQLRLAVDEAMASGLPGWIWSDADERAPVEAAARLVDAASKVDLPDLVARVEALELAGRFAGEAEQTRAQLIKFREFLNGLLTERTTLLSGGDPAALQARALATRERALAEVAAGETRLKAIADERARLQPVLLRLRAQQVGETCPTCGRPIVGKDIAVTIAAFERLLEADAAEERTLRAALDTARAHAAELEREAAALGDQATKIATLDGRIQTGESRIAETETSLASAEATLAEHLATHGWQRVPPPDELIAARSELEIGRRVTGARQLVTQLGATARQAIKAEAEAAWELEQLGPVAYDAPAHAGARDRVRAAEEAQARVRQIDAFLAQRPEREREVAAAAGMLAVRERERADREAERLALAFDPTLLEAARAAEAAAVVAEREARDARAAARAGHADAARTRDALASDQQRIQGLAEKAERRGREADELERMYREFNAFEQYVADRLTPRLADYTSELLGAITEGKFDKVEFTSNYGIEVYDGLDERFPVEEFSGGERDVIALCARLALSRLIGSQAANPPGFMVLDEVFGSLDRERRAQVLETFGSLAGSAEAFSQLFIISHVDDVRSSPIFNEVWRIAEGADGVSHLENLNVTGGFEDA